MSEFTHDDASAATARVRRVDVGNGKHVHIRAELSGADLAEAIEASRSDDADRIFRVCWLFLATQDGARRFPKDASQEELNRLRAWPVSVLVAIAGEADKAVRFDEDHEGN